MQRTKITVWKIIQLKEVISNKFKENSIKFTFSKYRLKTNCILWAKNSWINKYCKIASLKDKITRKNKKIIK